MSLPPAVRDISDHPLKDSVAEPTQRAAKNAEVERKLRVFGAIEAFRKGRLPANDQIDAALLYVLEHSSGDVENLSPGGKQLMQDTRYIVETARLMVREKNADELLQNFIWHTRKLEPGIVENNLGVKDSLPAASQVKAREEEGDHQVVHHLRTLLSIVLTNSEVRKLLTDFSVIGRDLLSKGLAKTAEVIAPSGQALRDVDQSAPTNRFVAKHDQPAGAGETSDHDVTVPGIDKFGTQNQEEHETRLQSDEDAGRPPCQVVVEGEPQREDVLGQETATMDQTATSVQQEDHDRPEADTEDEKAKKRGFVERMRNVRDNVRDGITDRIPQQYRDDVHERIEKGKKFLAEEYFPEERRDQFVFRGKKVIIECQKHDDYQESIRWLLSHIEEYASQGLERGKSGVKGSIANDNLKLPLRELRTLLERFANGTSLDVVIDPINVLIDDTRRDEGLRHWFTDVDAYIHKVLLEPGYVLDPDCKTRADELRTTGRQYYDEKYKGHFDDLFNSVSAWFGAMGDDQLNKRFGEDWARLTKDLLFDSEGSLKFKPELWNDIRKVVVPALIDQVGYIPIPRIEYSDDALDLVVENLTLSGRNLFPNIIVLEAHNYFKFSPYNAIEDNNHHRITLTLQQIQADMRDVAFYYRKKTGIPKMTDSGLADVLLGGGGLNATVVLVSADKDRSSVFKVHDVHVKVDSLKFSIRDSKHDFLYNTLRPLASGLIKRQIQKAIKDALTTGLEYVDGQLVAVRDRMEQAKTTEDESRTKILKDLLAGEASVKSESSQSHFHIVADKRHSILSSKGNPAGWVNRIADEKQAAVQGTEWRSEAYDVI